MNVRFRLRMRVSTLALTLGAYCALISPASAEVITQHPENPRYLSWRGEPVVLITSAEHYGALVNTAFDYERYFAALAADGMNYTRIFTGAYVEPQGAFNIERNTLAPAWENFIAPWPRSSEPAPGDLGNKFDLSRHNPAYLTRLRDLLRSADQHGVVVELTLFSSIYREVNWAANPLNPANNIQAYPVSDYKLLQSMDTSPEILAVQENFVRWLATELQGSPNLFFEIQNEPWGDSKNLVEVINPQLPKPRISSNMVQLPGSRHVAWQSHMARVITEAQQDAPHPHLIAQNVANYRLAVRADDLVPNLSIINFHYAYPEAVTWNLSWPMVLGYDESGFTGPDPEPYRRGAWRFIMAGGGLFNNLDYSYTVGHEDGLDLTNNAPGGGGPELRSQLRTLSEFIHSFDLARLQPDDDSITRVTGVVPYLLSIPGEQYGALLVGRGPATLHFNLPPGRYTCTWIDPIGGAVLKEEIINAGNEATPISSPPFDWEMALKIIRQDK